VAGGLLAGILADLLGYRAAIGFVAMLTAASGVVARLYLPDRPGAAIPRIAESASH
jgi:predicted MFS family arabinose efflux permease